MRLGARYGSTIGVLIHYCRSGSLSHVELRNDISFVHDQSLLVLLEPLVWLSILAKTVTSQVGLAGVVARAAGRTSSGVGLATLFAGLNRVDFAVGKLSLLRALVDFTILAEVAVLCDDMLAWRDRR